MIGRVLQNIHHGPLHTFPASESIPKRYFELCLGYTVYTMVIGTSDSINYGFQTRYREGRISCMDLTKRHKETGQDYKRDVA
jgi:hypothetical protein